MPKSRLSSTTASSSPSAPDLAALFSSISPSDFSAISSNLKMTPSESSRVQSALKDPAFMTLLADYAREITDPSLKAQNEAMLRHMEAEAKTAPSASSTKGRAEEKRQLSCSELDLD